MKRLDSPVPSGIPPFGQALKFRAKAVHEERLDHFQNVPFGGVMRSLRAALTAVHHGLEQRSEDRRGDLFPVESTCLTQARSHRRVKGGNFEPLPEEIAIHVRELLEIFVQVALAPVCRCVQNSEQMAEPSADIASVAIRPPRDQVFKDAPRLKDSGVIRKQTEEESHQKPFQVMPLISRCL